MTPEGRVISLPTLPVDPSTDLTVRLSPSGSLSFVTTTPETFSSSVVASESLATSGLELAVGLGVVSCDSTSKPLSQPNSAEMTGAVVACVGESVVLTVGVTEASLGASTGSTGASEAGAPLTGVAVGEPVSGETLTGASVDGDLLGLPSETVG